jgi:hypothetical protein
MIDNHISCPYSHYKYRKYSKYNYEFIESYCKNIFNCCSSSISYESISSWSDRANIDSKACISDICFKRVYSGQKKGKREEKKENDFFHKFKYLRYPTHKNNNKNFKKDKKILSLEKAHIIKCILYYENSHCS